MIARVIFVLFLVGNSLCSSDIHYDVARKHGGDGGVESKIECPTGGIFTGLRFRAASRVDRIEFICMSSLGESSIGPLGGEGGTVGSVSCPKGQYISSFYGRSAAKLDRLGIRCRSIIDLKSEGTRSGQFGGDGGYEFDDLAHSIGARPVSITVRTESEVDSIQVTYANKPIGQLCTECKYREKWAPQRGGEGRGGMVRTFMCPGDGVITGIKYRSALRVDSVEFTCTSSLGETKIGPFGGTGGQVSEDKCPPGSYIGSIHGRGADKIDQLGIRCVKVGQQGGAPKRDGHGGPGGRPFDDEEFARGGHRPVQIRVWSGSEVDAIQIKYGNLPIAMDCKVQKMRVTDKNILAESDGIEIIGITSGASCSSSEQKLKLEYAQSVSETVGVETTEGNELNWATEVSVSYTSGVNIGATAEVSVGLTQTVGGSKSWSHTNSKETTTEAQRLKGTEITYKAPGACIVVGYLNRYKIERENLPVEYEFRCAGGHIASQTGTIKLHSKTYGKAYFQDYHHEFPNKEMCTPNARSCVQALEANKVASDASSLGHEFMKCFNSK